MRIYDSYRKELLMLPYLQVIEPIRTYVIVIGITVFVCLSSFFLPRIRRINITVLRIFVITFVVYFFHICAFRLSYEFSRLALIESLAERQTFIIDESIFLTPKDVAYYDGHYYSIHAPGQAFLGVPVYLFCKWLFSIFFTEPSFDLIRWHIRFVFLITIVLISTFAVILVYSICKLFNMSELASILTAFVYAFGTIAWVYSQAFFPHPLSAFLLLVGVYFIIKSLKNEEQKPQRFLFISGLAMGYAILTEYTNFLVIVVITIYYFVYTVKVDKAEIKGKAKKFILFLIPVCACLIVLGIINYTLYDSFFETGYSHDPIAGSAVGFTTPLNEGLYGLLFSELRGLFYYSPILVIGCYGFQRFVKQNPYEAFLFGSSLLSILLLFSTWHTWWGGACYGPRFLLPVLSFLTIPLGFVVDERRKSKLFWGIFIILFLYSMSTMCIGVIVNVFVNSGRYVPNPPLYGLRLLRRIILQRGGLFESWSLRELGVPLSLTLMSVLIVGANLLISISHRRSVRDVWTSFLKNIRREHDLS